MYGSGSEVFPVSRFHRGVVAKGRENNVIVSVLWALLLIGVTMTIGALTESLDTYIVI